MRVRNRSLWPLLSSGAGAVMPDVSHKIEKRDDGNGQQIDSVIRIENGQEEIITTVSDLYSLFDECSRRWRVSGWDLEKLKTCIRECEFD